MFSICETVVVTWRRERDVGYLAIILGYADEAPVGGHAEALQQVLAKGEPQVAVERGVKKAESIVGGNAVVVVSGREQRARGKPLLILKISRAGVLLQ